MVADAVFLDLSSSSDEDEEDQAQNRNGSTDVTGLSYLSKACNLDVGDDDDDVVIIDKPTGNNDKAKRDKPRVIRSMMDDDECCMLDTDPAAAEATQCTPPLDSDELVMTGEKGPVACRDFPHARYLCVRFPFKTTPHSDHCTQCHCYVCDIVAPCSAWGDGNCGTDHCHAVDESHWKTLRKLTKARPVASSRAISVPAVTVAVQSPTSDVIGVSNPMGVSRFVPSSLTQAHATMPSPISPVVAPIPGNVGVPLVQAQRTNATTGPLVIRLRGRSRGRPSQPLHHLGVVHPHKQPHRSGNSNRPLPVPAPAERISEIVRPQQPPQFTPYLNPGPLYPTPAPPVNFQTFFPCPAPPLPNDPPPYIPPPPPCVYPLDSQPGAYNIYQSPGVTYDQYPIQQQQQRQQQRQHQRQQQLQQQQLQLQQQQQQQQMPGFVPDTNASVPGSRYVSDMGPQFHGSSEPAAPTEDFKSPVVSLDYAGAGYGADVLAGPTDRWVTDVGDSLFDSFTTSVVGPDSRPTSLEKVLEQMAGDDYLWEQFPPWS